MMLEHVGAIKWQTMNPGIFAHASVFGETGLFPPVDPREMAFTCSGFNCKVNKRK